MTHLRPPVSTYSVASSCQHAFGAGYTNRRNDARGRLFGAALATPASRNTRDSVAFDGADNPIAIIFARTLIGPWSSPDCSNDARTPSDCRFTSSLNRVGDVRGRRDFGSSTAAGPSVAARARRR
jgi:hypothetical protein